MENLPQYINDNSKIYTISIFPSGDFIVSTKNKLKLYDSNNNVINTINNAHDIYAIYIINQNKFYTGNVKGNIEKWKFNKNNNEHITYEREDKFKAHNNEISKLLVINDYIYTCSYDGTITIRNIKTIQETLYKIEGLESVSSIIHDEDYELLVCSSSKGFFIYNDLFDTENKINEIYSEELSIFSQNTIQFFEKNDKLIKIIVGCENLIKIYSVSKDNNVNLTQQIQTDYICSAIYVLESNEKIKFITGELHINSYAEDENNKIRIYQNIDIIHEQSYAHKSKINGFIKFRDNTLLSYSNDGIIKFWRINLN